MQAFLEFLMNFDVDALLWIQDNLRMDLLTQVLTVLTRLGDKGMLWVAIAVVLLVPKSTRKAGFVAIMAMVGSLLIVDFFLKPQVARIRPYEVIQSLELLVPEASDWSFPSGHASSGFAAAVSILLAYNKKLGIPMVILAAIIAFSRLYVGIHYPTDVIFGMIIGILLALISYWIFGARLVDKKKKRQEG